MMHTITDFKKAKLKTEPSIYLPRLTNYAYKVKVYVYLSSTDLLLNNGSLGFSISL